MKILTVCLLTCAVTVLAQASAPEAKADNNQTVSTLPVKRWPSCSPGWSGINGRCLHFVPRAMTWAQAEKNCESRGGTLASVHSVEEYHGIQHLILSNTHELKQSWIGGSDAQENNVWLWSDGSPFHYTNWCSGEPSVDQLDCLTMNYSVNNCWGNFGCSGTYPSVCAKKNICSLG